MIELADGIRRITLPLPTKPGHVHAYLLDGGTLVDTGLGLPDARERWAEALRGVRVERVVVTHFHPDHVGAAADLAELTGAPVHQGELDYLQCAHVWGNPEWPSVIAAWFVRNGVPEDVTRELIERGEMYRRLIRFARDPVPLRDGDEIDGWRVVETPGHADGHLCLVGERGMISGDHVLPRISPSVGLYPDSRADPLGDYLQSLERTIALAPPVVFGGHGDPVTDPATRVRELIDHHRRRLDDTAAALGGEPLTGYATSFALFGDDLAPAARRFAVAETLSHLERLVVEGRAARHEDGRLVTYTPAETGGRRDTS